jgi:hypothetical protein
MEYILIYLILYYFIFPNTIIFLYGKPDFVKNTIYMGASLS